MAFGPGTKILWIVDQIFPLFLFTLLLINVHQLSYGYVKQYFISIYSKSIYSKNVILFMIDKTWKQAYFLGTFKDKVFMKKLQKIP